MVSSLPLSHDIFQLDIHCLTIIKNIPDRPRRQLNLADFVVSGPFAFVWQQSGRAEYREDFQGWEAETGLLRRQAPSRLPSQCRCLADHVQPLSQLCGCELAQINEGGWFTKPSERDAKAYAKYDNDLFQTGRLVTCSMYINIILKDYVRTILNVHRTNSVWSLDPRSDIGDSVALATGNQVSAEFNLVYCWHSCVSQRDQKWTEDLYNELFPGKDPK